MIIDIYWGRVSLLCLYVRYVLTEQISVTNACKRHQLLLFGPLI